MPCCPAIGTPLYRPFARGDGDFTADSRWFGQGLLTVGVERGAWSVISLPSASPVIGHCPLFPRHSPSQSPTVGASPEDPRRTKQSRSESSRDQRAGKTNFAACQAELVRNHGEESLASRFRER